MCGIAGIIEREITRNKAELGVLANSMAKLLAHRGPDDAGVWVDSDHGVALSHRRLSILDLSPEGKQPMLSRGSRYTVVFNGEIYNFKELRSNLEKKSHCFSGSSDTEVLLASVVEWGIRGALERFVGMFAFALWDADQQVLTLARDRLGEKPLYYGWAGKSLLFASELKAFRAVPDWSQDVDRDALALYFHGGYIPGPSSIYQGFRKLPPSSMLDFPLNNLSPGRLPDPIEYWSLESQIVNGATHPFPGSSSDAVDTLDALIRKSVAGQLVADVPVGAFLSGGVDSSVVVAAMQAQSRRPIRTFTIGFHEKEFNEATHAAAVAAHLGTDHTELYVTGAEAMAVIPRLPEIYDEPFSDSSQIPTFLVSQLARRNVTVSLSGDGGDELFGGYPRYAITQRLWGRLKLIPFPVRQAIAKTIRSFSVESWNSLLKFLPPLQSSSDTHRFSGDRAHKAAELLNLESVEALYWRLISHWKQPENLVLGATNESLRKSFLARCISIRDLLNRLSYADCVSYLPDDILVKVDRASMAVSLESRAPLLDHRIVEFAFQIPPSFKVRNGKSKWLLREVLYRYVPRELIDRPKMGFGVPLDRWLRGPLRDWAESLLSPQRLKREGFLNVGAVRQKWEEHLSGKRLWHYYIWDVLMFQAWLESQRSTSEKRNSLEPSTATALT